MAVKAIAAQQLYTRCDAGLLGFETTRDIAEPELALGQERAVDAMRFAIDMPHQGYNPYVSGSTGVGRRQLIDEILRQHEHDSSAVFDWCYLHNFEAPHKPCLLKLEQGIGGAFKREMEKLVERLLVALPNMFQSDEYRQRVSEMQEAFQEREEKLFKALESQAREKDLAVMRTPGGFSIGPVKGGKLLSPQEFHALPEREQEEIKQAIDEVNDALRRMLETVNSWQEEGLEKLKALNQGFVRQAIDPVMMQLKARYQHIAEVASYLEAVHVDITDSAAEFMGGDDEAAKKPAGIQPQAAAFQRYQVNLFVDNSGVDSVPIVYEDNPTYQNLIGRVEHVAEYGALSTNFTLIKPGALHRANGGYLILDAHTLLTNGFSWPALKRVLRSREIRIESIERVLSLASTVTLEPEPIPAAVKVVLCGDRMLYYLLRQYDPDFSGLFKVQADFSESIERNPQVSAAYGLIIGTIARRQGLAPLSAAAVARVIEQSARWASDLGHLSLHMQRLSDLIREADYQARKCRDELIGPQHVQAAVDSARWRSNRYLELMQEQIEQGALVIATAGKAVAQINGLSVFQLGDFSFGRPSRITATARVGTGRLVDIERESELGGAIHSKGVMILSALLASRYARNKPLALSATLVFEQSYGPVDGDSASVAELLVLLSAITQQPLRQSLAVTGSIDQLGRVQAIGGVNEKIEGFFDVCRMQGLNGRQGVAIPASNVRHLMLREDVVEACAQGQFAVYPLASLDDAIALFTGRPAGDRQGTGRFEAGSFNHLVQQRLDKFCKTAMRRRKRSEGGSGDGDDG